MLGLPCLCRVNSGEDYIPSVPYLFVFFIHAVPQPFRIAIAIGHSCSDKYVDSGIALPIR